MNNRIVLINFYMPKALGIKHIEKALTQAGYDVTTVFFKNISFINPKGATAREIELLVELVKSKDPLAVGLSVMASFYMETIIEVNDALKQAIDVPIVWGGIYPTMFAEECLKHADLVVRSEGEETFIELADMLKSGVNDFANIRNLAYRDEGGAVVQNELRDLLRDLDKFGWLELGLPNKYIIDNDIVKKHEDPLLGSMSYEISCSRGCPHACSYCSSSAWKRIHAGKGKTVRLRSIDSVIDELAHAKAKMKNLKYIRFYDEIFPEDEAWVDEFCAKYKARINLPFEVWGHPRHADAKNFAKFVNVGLYKVTMGLQSGSPYIRRQIFNRPETNEDIIAASQSLVDAKVPEVIFDLMVRHHFETHDTLRETLFLCLELKGKFELRLHGLNFLPGTAIVQKAIDKGLVSPEEMERFLNAPMHEQYEMYWKNENCDETMNYIYKLVSLTQVPRYKKKVMALGQPDVPEQRTKVERMYKIGMRSVRVRHIWKKLVMLGKGTVRKIFGR
ncbi:MAG: cobalamin-dependent protein [Oscillospiraceae bacterium]|nr:cobalamin-dependent protein [Oscillospiraceae bacterium]